jgi:hypothetical protein
MIKTIIYTCLRIFIINHKHSINIVYLIRFLSILWWRTNVSWKYSGYCNLNTWEDEEVAFIEQRSGAPLQWRHISRNIEGHNIEDKIHLHCFQIWSNLLCNLLQPFMIMYKYNNWIIFARFGNKNQTRRQNMAEIVFSWGVSEIKCIIFNDNNDNPYEIHNNYIKLSIVFHPMIIFFRK